MTIRRAMANDAPRLVEMGMRFLTETPYREHVSPRPERLAAVVAQILGNPDGVMLVSEASGRVTGMIGMVAYEHPFSGERVAGEVVWWVEPEARGDGLRLLRAAETWARGVGARRIQMIAPDARVCALYGRLGYEAVEVTWQARL